MSLELCVQGCSEPRLESTLQTQHSRIFENFMSGVLNELKRHATNQPSIFSTDITTSALPVSTWDVPHAHTATFCGSRLIVRAVRCQSNSLRWRRLVKRSVIKLSHIFASASSIFLPSLSLFVIPRVENRGEDLRPALVNSSSTNPARQGIALPVLGNPARRVENGFGCLVMIRELREACLKGSSSVAQNPRTS